MNPPAPARSVRAVPLVSGLALVALIAVWLLPLGASGCNGEFRFDELDAEAGADGALVDAGDDGAGDEAADNEAGVDADAETDALTPGTCRIDDDCASLGLHCDMFSGRCVQCDEDVHCGDKTPRCDTALHRCVECGSAADCGGSNLCDSHTHRCIDVCDPHGASTCPLPLSCRPNSQRCEQCDDDYECGAGATACCDPDLRRCVGCSSDAYCSGTTPLCDRTRGQCVECMLSDQCPTDRPLCNAAGTCVEPSE